MTMSYPGQIKAELIEAQGNQASYRYWCKEYGYGQLVIDLDDDTYEAIPSTLEPESLPAAKRAMVKARKLKLVTGAWSERLEYVAY
jgi:hypothetical protein